MWGFLLKKFRFAPTLKPLNAASKELKWMFWAISLLVPILWSSFHGDKPLAPAKPSWAIPEGVEILQKGVTQSQPKIPNGDTSRRWCPCTDHCCPFSSKQPSPPSSKPKHYSSGPQTPILMFFKELKGHEQSSWSNLESHKDETIFHKHESSSFRKNPRSLLWISRFMTPLCAREVQQVLHPF
jgi:hypothetical protein